LLYVYTSEPYILASSWYMALGPCGFLYPAIAYVLL
jgi:hypothetical protein